MKIEDVPFSTVDWSSVEGVVHPGETGTAVWRTQQAGDIRIRMVDYSPGYQADHWCPKGHVLLVLEGQLETELEDGRSVTLRPGQSYHVGDGSSAHRSRTASGAKLFIVD
jgi:quercetin dioxygenase-like cupin family protein